MFAPVFVLQQVVHVFNLLASPEISISVYCIDLAVRELQFRFPVSFDPRASAETPINRLTSLQLGAQPSLTRYQQ